jgi:hypothetical protein
MATQRVDGFRDAHCGRGSAGSEADGGAGSYTARGERSKVVLER